MIYDSLDRLADYLPLFAPEVAESICAFLPTLTSETADGSHQLCATVRCNVATYETKERPECLREIHRRHIDIQILLDGAELNHCCPADGLAEETPYHEEGDYQFVARNGQEGAELPLQPGRFAIYFPHDAHLTGIRPDGMGATVKKAVFKIRISS